jgi:hypothetical protein
MDMYQIKAFDKNMVLTPEEEARAKANGDFMQKLKDEGKLSEFLKQHINTPEIEDTEWDILLR